MTWKNPLLIKGTCKLVGGESTPFVFKDRLYRLDNVPSSFRTYPAVDPNHHKGGYHEDETQIRDVETDDLVSVPLRDHYFAIAYVWEGRVYIFAGDHQSSDGFWRITRVNMIYSDDLVNWSEPQMVLKGENNEHFFNFGVCRGPEGFVMLYETDDTQWNIFTFKYLTSDDLISWTRIPGGLYGTDKYVGGPALYFEGGFYYTLYLHSLGNSHYETRITRSKDCVHWEDAPEDRPFLTYDSGHITDPENFPGVAETNASDAELCYWNGKTIVYFNGGNQGEITRAGDLQLAEFIGTPGELFERFFENV